MHFTDPLIPLRNIHKHFNVKWSQKIYFNTFPWIPKSLFRMPISNKEQVCFFFFTIWPHSTHKHHFISFTFSNLERHILSQHDWFYTKLCWSSFFVMYFLSTKPFIYIHFHNFTWYIKFIQHFILTYIFHLTTNITYITGFWNIAKNMWTWHSYLATTFLLKSSSVSYNWNHINNTPWINLSNNRETWTPFQFEYLMICD